MPKATQKGKGTIKKEADPTRMKAAPKRTKKPKKHKSTMKCFNLKAQQSSQKPQVDTTVDLDEDTPPALVVNIRQQKPEAQQQLEVVASTGCPTDWYSTLISISEFSDFPIKKDFFAIKTQMV